MRNKVTISDIARQSGVSVSTVSLVLNNKPGVSQETRARVLQVAEELGYPITPTAAAARSRRLATVGMVVKTDPDIPPQANPFYSKVMVGIEDVCRRNGMNLLFATLPVDEYNRPLEIPQMLANEIVDGLLMLGFFVDEDCAARLSAYDVPIVLVDGYSDSDCYDSVVSDNFRAAYQAVEHLLSRGHRRIGLVGGEGGSFSFPSLRDRRNGYLRALKENGISEIYTADFNINQSHGFEETLALLREHPQITALFCVNDDAASDAIRAVQELGRRVPEDLSVIGYDDTYIASHTHPRLSSMHVDTTAMGRSAVHLLSLRADNPESARMTLTIHPTLVERESVGPVPAG